MTQRGLSLGRIFGIPIQVHVSWVFIAMLMTLSFAVGFSRSYPYLGLPARVSLGLSSCLLLFASVLAHELSHAVVALRNDVGIRRITLFIFGGAAEMVEEPKRASAEFRIAIAGPIMSLVLAVFFWVLYGLALGSIPLPFTDVFGILARLNFMLVAFNAIPGFPLDGGRVLRAALWGIWGTFHAATRVASAVGSAFGALIVLMGFVWMVESAFGGVWFILIGLFLRYSARASYEQLVVRQAISGVVARDLMTEDVACVPPDMRLATVVDVVLRANGAIDLPVVDRGLLVGMLPFRSVRGRGRAELDRLTARELMERDAVDDAIAPDDEALKVLTLLGRGDKRLPVVSEGVLVGMLNRDDVLDRLRVYLETEPEA